VEAGLTSHLASSLLKYLPLTSHILLSLSFIHSSIHSFHLHLSPPSLFTLYPFPLPPSFPPCLTLPYTDPFIFLGSRLRAVLPFALHLVTLHRRRRRRQRRQRRRIGPPDTITTSYPLPRSSASVSVSATTAGVQANAEPEKKPTFRRPAFARRPTTPPFPSPPHHAVRDVYRW
jgi:hypothetical protein